jgi:hypothetical protein
MPQSGTGQSDPETTHHPTCPKCKEQMTLTTIEPMKDGYDCRTFECAACHHRDQVLVKFWK